MSLPCLNKVKLHMYSDPQRNATGQSTELKPLVPLLFGHSYKSLSTFIEHSMLFVIICILIMQGLSLFSLTVLVFTVTLMQCLYYAVFMWSCVGYGYVRKWWHLRVVHTNKDKLCIASNNV